MNQLERHINLMTAMPPWRGAVPEGYVGNFLGVFTKQDYIALHAPSNTMVALSEGEGEVPAPRVTDGDPFFEFAVTHDAVMAARDRFVMIELGGGYGSRCVDAHAAVQRFNPMPCSFVLVEAEPVHFQWMQQHLQDNGINPKDHWLIEGAVAGSSEAVPFLTGAGMYYNSIVDEDLAVQVADHINAQDASHIALRNLLATGSLGVEFAMTSLAGDHLHDVKYVSARPLSEILRPLGIVDLIDIDIQGAEASVLPEAIEDISRKVKRVYLATHGADIHKALWDLFFEAEWMCEFDFPPFSVIGTPWGEFTTTDGILAFTNTRF